MTNRFFALGVSWRTAPVATREKLAFKDEEVGAELGRLLEVGPVDEAMILSTCNRVELYGVASSGATAASAASVAREFLATSRRQHAEALSEHLFESTGIKAVDHVFRVASALDSLIIGETQILGQLKAAYGVATSHGATGRHMARWIERSFRVAKRVRNETELSRGAANISSVAVDLAKRVFGTLAGKSVAIVGAGKMSALAARHLRASGVGGFTTINRSPERAEELADLFEGIARPWSELLTVLQGVDIVITSTASEAPILTTKELKRLMKKRRYEPLVIIDIAVPRDVEPDAGHLDGVYLFNVDDLENVVASNLAERVRASKDAEAIVVDEIDEFSRWWDGQTVGPLIAELRNHFHVLAAGEVERFEKRLRAAGSSEEQNKVLEAMARGLVNKILHHPMMALKHNQSGTDLVGALQELFPVRASRQKTRSDQSESQAIVNPEPNEST